MPRKFKTVSNQEYGKASMQQESMAAVSPAPPQSPPPALLDDFFAETARPNEPITHGIDVGAGGGSNVMPNFAVTTDDTMLHLRAMFQKYPTEDLADLIQVLEAG